MKYEIIADYHNHKTGKTLKQGQVLTLVEIAEILDIEPTQEKFNYFYFCLGLRKSLKEVEFDSQEVMIKFEETHEVSEEQEVMIKFSIDSDIKQGNKILLEKGQLLSEAEIIEIIGKKSFDKALKNQDIIETKVIKESDV